MRKLKRRLLLAKLYFKAFFLSIPGRWEDDLLRCPSQCCYEFDYEGKHYAIYLRWRWSDPWTADLIKNYHWNDRPDEEWIYLAVDFYTEDELAALKVNAMWETKKTLAGLYNLPAL